MFWNKYEVEIRYIFFRKITCKNGFYGFTVFDGNKALGDINLNVYGKHNVLNAIAAVAVARTAGIPFARIKEGLASFTGVERRFERIGKLNGAVCIADYAHHPFRIAGKAQICFM